MTPIQKQQLTGDCDEVVTTTLASLLPIHKAGTIEWLVDAASTAAERAFGAPFTLVYWADQEGRLHRRLPASDLRRRQVQRAIDAFGDAALPIDIDPQAAPAIGEALQTRTPLITSAQELLRGLADGDAAAAAQRSLGVASLAIVPMEEDSELAGALVVLLARPTAAEQLRLLGEHVACAAANLHAALAASAEPKGAVARPVFDERKIANELERELARAARYQRELSLVVVEATNLQLLRDQFGKFLADRLYAALGASLAQAARDTDIVGVYRERGYTVILTEAQTDGATAARRLLTAALATTIEGEVPGLELHLAAGWASFPGDGTACDTLLEMVQLRMYDDESQQLVA